MADAHFSSDPEVAQAREDLFGELSRLKERERENRDLEERGQPRVPMDHRRMVEYTAAYVKAFPADVLDSARQQVADFDRRLKSAGQPDSKLGKAASASWKWLKSLNGPISGQPYFSFTASSLARKGQLIAKGSYDYARLECFRDMSRSLTRLLEFRGLGSMGRATASNPRAALRRWLKEAESVLSDLAPHEDLAEALRSVLQLLVDNGHSEFCLWSDKKFAYDDYIKKFDLGIRWLEK